MQATPYRDSKLEESDCAYVYWPVDRLKQSSGSTPRDFIAERMETRFVKALPPIQGASSVFLHEGQVLYGREYFICNIGIHFCIIKRNVTYSSDKMPTPKPRYVSECAVIGPCDGSCGDRIEMRSEDWPAKDERAAFELASNPRVGSIMLKRISDNKVATLIPLAGTLIMWLLPFISDQSVTRSFFLGMFVAAIATLVAQQSINLIVATDNKRRVLKKLNALRLQPTRLRLEVPQADKPKKNERVSEEREDGSRDIPGHANSVAQHE